MSKQSSGSKAAGEKKKEVGEQRRKSGPSIIHWDQMGGEKTNYCYSCRKQQETTITCTSCGLHTCIDCDERFDAKEYEMTKLLGLDWAKVDVCLMCLEVMNLRKGAKGVKDV